MSETMQTVVEATKISAKWIVIFAIVFGIMEAFEWLYLQYGYSATESSLYGILTLGIPFGIITVSYTHLRAHETKSNLVFRRMR